jgi:hypothetical protein
MAHSPSLNLPPSLLSGASVDKTGDKLEAVAQRRRGRLVLGRPSQRLRLVDV